MTIETALLGALALMLALNVPVTAILIRAALVRPRIRFLTTSATLSALITATVMVYVGAVANREFRAPFNEDLARIILRVVLLALAAYPLWWLWLYFTGRFRDGER